MVNNISKSVFFGNVKRYVENAEKDSGKFKCNQP